MKLTFLGAAHEVTGSCSFLDIAGKKILVDCGMEQGPNIYENQSIPVNASDIDSVFLTHAHIDHSGLIPLLYSNGFRGAVYATEATCDLCEIMLRDSAHIQEFEAEWRNRKAKRAGKDKYVPLYTMQDAIDVMKQFVACKYEEKVCIYEGITIRFIDVGHLLGSASIEIWITENDIERKIVFSGDIGNINQPIIKDPTYITEADYVVTEATYGNRSHGDNPDYVHEFTKIIEKTFDRGGNVVIPSFAVGRTQEILYFIRQIKAEKRLEKYKDFEVYLDSPLAIEATKLFKEHSRTNFDEEALELIQKGINPLDFEGLKFSITSGESKLINIDRKPKIIISASGMCEAGRIRHHLKHNLWRMESTILFVGYQANGTLGRTLINGISQVKLFGEEIEIKAEICALEGISGHADREGLIRWVQAFDKQLKNVFVVHGEDSVCDEYAELLTKKYNILADAPYSGAVYDLAAGEWIYSGNVIKIKKDMPKYKVSAVFERLLAAGQRLIYIINKNKEATNKDLAKFADQINSLCEKWDK
jgi:Predicted exonuclease of the beta-lactamase fold involved in RNA processing